MLPVPMEQINISLYNNHNYRGIIHICVIHCARIVKIVLVRGDVILWVTGLLHENARQCGLWISTNIDPPQTLMIPQCLEHLY